MLVASSNGFHAQINETNNEAYFLPDGAANPTIYRRRDEALHQLNSNDEIQLKT